MERRASACLRNQLMISPLALALTIIGMPIAGAAGAAWGLAAAGAVAVVIWMRSWVVEIRLYERRVAAGDPLVDELVTADDQMAAGALLSPGDPLTTDDALTGGPIVPPGTGLTGPDAPPAP